MRFVGVFVICAGIAAGQRFGGEYKKLEPMQQRLFADVLQRYNQITGKNLEVEQAYNAGSFSMRSTFEAVTNALIHTPLTDASGKVFGAAVDIVESIDEIAGERKGMRGDLQFRLYVNLKPGAADLLRRSREFRQGGDNTVYHKGFPINFRQAGGVPTMQISMSRDERAADIDVDYRSARIPKSMFNGHLTSANSDVRVGSNYERHINRWTGLAEWWRNLFGIPPASEPTRTTVIPLKPGEAGKSNVAAATQDFLDSWWSGKPEAAVAYFARESFGCSPDEDGRTKGLLRYQMLEALRKARLAIPKETPLSAYVKAVPAWDERMKPQPAPEGSPFLVAQLRDDLALAYDCDARNGFGRVSKPSTNFGNAYLSAFSVQRRGQDAVSVVFVWRKAGDYWRIVAFESGEGDPAAPAIRGSSTRPQVAGPERVPGDPTAQAEIARFFDAWLVRGRVDEAVAAFSPEAYGCVASEFEKPGPNPRTTLRKGLAEARQAFAKRGKLSEIIAAPEVTNENVRLIAHPRDSEFALIPVPEEIGREVKCGKDLPPPDHKKMSSASGTSAYYVSLIRFVAPGDPPSLYQLWEKQPSGWKVVYFRVETH